MGVVQDYLNKTGKTSTSRGSLIDSYNAYKSKKPSPVAPKKATAPTVKGGLSSLFNPVTNPVSTPIAKSNPFQSPLQEVIKKQVADNKAKKTEVPFKIDTSNIKEQESIIKESPVSVTSAKATPKAKEKIREYVTDEGSLQPTVDKITANPTVKKVLTGIARRTSGTGIVATLKSASPEVTFAQAYEVARKAQAEKNDTLIEQFISGIGDTLPQTALGVALGFVPYVGIPLSIAYFSAISAGSELEEKGKVTLTNVAIDVVLDRVLGKTLESLLKSPAKTLFRTVKKAFVTEGGTEVAQDLLKYGNNYRLATTDEEKEAVLKEAQEYFTSGQILVTAGVGGISGGGIAIVGSVLSPQQAINETLGTPKQDTPESKKIISVAVEAQQRGLNIKITEDGAEITNEEPKVAPIIAPEPKVETKPEQGLTPEVKPKIVSNGRDGIVPEWGTQNQYYLNNPYKAQLDSMSKSGNFDKKIIFKANEWEMQQVLKDKPAYLSSNELPIHKIYQFAKDNNLVFGQKPDGTPVIAKTQEALDAVLNAKTQREIGLSLGYKDLLPQSGLTPEVKTVTKKVKQKKSVKLKKKVTTPKTPSKIARSIEAKAIESKLTKGFESLAGYEKVSVKNQRIRATRVMRDIEQARRILRGEEDLPAGLKGISLITAVEEQIAKTGDMELAYELANSPLISGVSAAAQELRLAAERIPDSATLRLQQLKNRIDKKIGNAEEKKAKVKNKLKEEIKKNNLSKEETSIDNFINSIIC